MVPPQYSLEPELTTNPPRRVKTTVGVQLGRLLWLAIVLLGVFELPSCAQQDLANMRALRDHGRHVAGKIVGKDADATNNHTDYSLRYKYVVAGKAYLDKEDVEEDQYDSTNVGDLIEITYMPGDPSNHHEGDVTDMTVKNQLIGWIVAIAVLLFGLFAVALIRESGLRMRAGLLRDGAAAQAIVADRQTTNGSCLMPFWLRRSSYQLTCNFYAGQQPVSRPFFVSSELYRQMVAGSSLTVLYLPQSPSICRPYLAIKDVVLDKTGSRPYG